MKRTYIKTCNPRLNCPSCKTHLRISNLQQKLWCQECNEYIDEEKLMEGFVKNIE